MIGKTNSQVGGGIKGEKVNISLLTNQSEHSALMGAAITVKHGENETQYVWEGVGITVTIPPYEDYEVSVSGVAGYKTPDKFTAMAQADNARSLNFEYKAERVKVTLSAAGGADMNGTTVNIYGQEYTFSGTPIEVLVPFDEVYSVQGGAFGSLVAPLVQSFTASIPLREINLEYRSCVLVVNMLSNQVSDATIAALKASVKYGSTTIEVANGVMVDIPSGTDITVTFPEVENYNTPSAITFTSVNGINTQSATYITERVIVNASGNDGGSVDGVTASVARYKKTEYTPANGVYIQDTEGFLYTEAEWDGTKTPNGIAVVTSACKFVIALNDVSTRAQNLVTDGAYDNYGITDSYIAKADYNGVGNTKKYTAPSGSALYLCKAYTFPNGQRGYLGAAGEWYQAIQSSTKSKIKTLLQKLNCSVSFLSSGVWTSTFYNNIEEEGSWYTVFWLANASSSILDYNAVESRAFVRPFTTLDVAYKMDTSDPEEKEIVNGKAEFKVSHGTQYEVSMSAKEGYSTPAMQSFVADSVTRNVSMVYEAETVTVNVSSSDNKIEGYEVTVSQDAIVGDTKYIPLEYIESTGTQHINTGFNPKSTTRVIASFARTSDKFCVFGSRNSESDGGFLLFYNSSMYRSMYGGEYLYTEVNSNTGVVWSVDMNGATNSLIVNGQEFSYESPTSFECNQPLYLFNFNEGGSLGNLTGSVRLYSCQIYDNETLVRDYIPVKREDGIAGLYDLVEGKFYPSNGSGNFVASSNVGSVVIGTQNSVTGTYKIPYGQTYTVSASPVDGYSTPVSQTFTASQVNRVVDVHYQLSGLKLNILSNQANDTALADVKATVTYGSNSVELGNGESLSLSANTEVTITFPDVPDYKTPEPITFTHTSGYSEKTGTYLTEKVTVDVSANDGEDTDGQVVSVDSVVPAKTTEGVYIQDTEGRCWLESEWDGSKTPNGIAVVAKECSFVIALKRASTTVNWSTSKTLISGIATTTVAADAIKDYKGSANTDVILKALGASVAIAVNNCKTFVFPDGTAGYMGAAGEWEVALQNKAAIDSAMAKCGGVAIDTYCWTSTQYSTNEVWYRRWDTATIQQSAKDNILYPRAFAVLKDDSFIPAGKKEYSVENGKVEFKVAHDTTCSVSVDDKTDYATPVLQSFKASEVNRTLNFVYQTETVKVTVSANDGVSVDGQVVMVAKNGMKDFAPDFAAIDEYGVAIMDIYGNFYQDAASWQAAGSPTANGVAVSDGTHRFCIAKVGVTHVASTGAYADFEYWGANNVTVSGVTTTQSVAGAKADFYGVVNTDAIVENVKSSDGKFTVAPWSAAGLCRQFAFPNGSKGYMGAGGEWSLVQNSIDSVNTLLTAIGGTKIDTSGSPQYWASTQYGSTSAWRWDFSTKTITNYNKPNNSRVRAFSSLETVKLEDETSETHEVTNGKVTFKVAHGTEYSVSVNDKTGYKTPASVTHTASESSRTIPMVYQTETVTVNVGSNDGEVSGFEVSIIKGELVGDSDSYTRLDYIESTGTQYIDTGFKPNQDTRVDIKVSGFSNGSNGVLFGARTSNTSSDRYLFIASGNNAYRVSYYNQDEAFGNDVNFPDELTVVQNKNVTILNGGPTLTCQTGTFNTPFSLHLLSNNNNGSPSGYAKLKLYYCQIYDNDTLVRDYVPVLRSDGVAGLFDLVNQKFYASSGSGNFVAGVTVADGEKELVATQTTASGTYKIPFGESYILLAGKVDGYEAPATKAFIASQDNRTVDLQYLTERVTVNVSSNDNAISGFEVSVVKNEMLGNATKYTRLAYIESTGTQWIDTGFIPNQDTSIYMDVIPTTVAAGVQSGIFFGSSYPINKHGIEAYIYDGNFTFEYGGTSSVKDTKSSANVRYQVAIEKNVSTAYLNGEEYYKVVNPEVEFTAAKTLHLCSLPREAQHFGLLKIYSCQIYDNDVLVRDYYPALRADGIAGLYDAVHDKFYPSNGTGNFVSGGEYKEVLGTQTSVTGTYKVPFGDSYSVVANAVDGYTTPASQTFIASQDSRVVSVEYQKFVATDLSKQDVHGNKITQTTANCYVVSEAGDYMIPIAYGAAIKNGQVNAASFTYNGGYNSYNFLNYKGKAITSPYVETDTGSVATSVQMSISDTENAVTNLGIINGDGCKYISFSVPSVPKTGANAVISVKDADGIIMWNWHIWLWEDDLTPVEITNATSVAYNILPVNLGSKWDEDAKTHIKNWFYQWGRPTPLLCPLNYGSSLDHTSYGALSFIKSSIAESYIDSIKNPTTFFAYSASYNANWFKKDSNRTYNFWDAGCTTAGTFDNNVIKTVYDPCPVGFKMPNGNTFTGCDHINSLDMGLTFVKRYPSDTVGIGFPRSGYRIYSPGDITDMQASGNVYTSAPQGTDYVYYTQFKNPTTTTSYRNRANACSVRPVTDTGLEGQTKLTVTRIDQTIADPEAMITRIVDLGGIEAVRANSHRYTGQVNADGVMELKQLKDTDGTKYLDGSAATLTTQGVDVWMKLPQFYWKCVQVETDVFDFYVAYGAKPDDTYKTWDGKDLIGAYKAYLQNEMIYSRSGVAIESVGQGFSKIKEYARNRGDGFTLIKWKHRCMIAMLSYSFYSTTEMIGRIGYGYDQISFTTGSTNSLCMTDTTFDTNEYNHVNLWGLESLWGAYNELFDNVTVYNNTWTITEDDGSTRTVTGHYNSNGFIKKMYLGENIDLVPTQVGSSSSTSYVCYYRCGVKSATLIPASGQSHSNEGGLVDIDTSLVENYATTNYGFRLAYRGNYQIIN